MPINRRDLFKFVGGSAMGALFTPAPWRLITDSALWSENWPGIPRPARGEIRAKFTHCALCPAGCAVRARCVGDQPVALAGARGGLCPFGITGHHLPYHPTRLRQGPTQEAAAAISAGMAKLRRDERVAVLTCGRGAPRRGRTGGRWPPCATVCTSRHRGPRSQCAWRMRGQCSAWERPCWMGGGRPRPCSRRDRSSG